MHDKELYSKILGVETLIVDGPLFQGVKTGFGQTSITGKAADMTLLL